tara:strand:- start:147 stop:581 length:435 start_codon:yes stop_codon:yes gene_type:complete
MEEDLETEIYFGNDRYLMKNRYYAKDAEWEVEAQQRGWSVKLYDAKDSNVMEFFSWWYWDAESGLSGQGENEEFFIENPHSEAVKELLKILEPSTKTSYKQVYKSSGEAWFVIGQLRTAILYAQEQRELLFVSLNNPPRYKRNL